MASVYDTGETWFALVKCDLPPTAEVSRELYIIHEISPVLFTLKKKRADECRNMRIRETCQKLTTEEVSTGFEYCSKVHNVSFEIKRTCTANIRILRKTNRKDLHFAFP